MDGKIQRTFNAQRTTKIKTFKAILIKQIWRLVNVDKLGATWDADLIDDVCKNKIQDLPLDELLDTI